MRSIHCPGANVRMIRRVLIAAGFTALAVPVCLGQAGAPTTPPSSPSANSPYVASMTFDVVSVRESKPNLDKGFMVGGGFAGKSSSLKMTNNSIRNMLALAYGLSVYQLQGLPDWTSRAMYNVQAKSDDATDEKLAILSREQARLEQQHMMQALLADRFNLKTHWETHDGLVYNLVVAKGGPKMQAGGSLAPSAEELKGFGDRKMPEIHQRGNGKRGYEFIGHDCHMTSLTGILGMLMANDVIDKTGLTGTYDFDLQYSQAPDTQREEDLTIWPQVTDAIAEQLGLKLERGKGPVKTLVVDHIDQPSQN
jgi:uncharacterized protein (TIGR03435 family)